MKKLQKKKIPVYIVLVLISITFVFPFVWLLASSFKIASDIFSPTFSLVPRDEFGNIWFNLTNYTIALEYLNFGKIFTNTLIVCVSCTVLNLCLNSLAAYAFARLQFKGRDLIFKISLTSMMIPGTVLLIPNLMLINKLGLYDTLGALILPFAMSVYNIFLLRQQFLSLSKEIEEAALLDGASPFVIFREIALPLVKPMLVVLGITTFMWNYNNFLWPLVATQSEELFTLARSLGDLVAAGGSNVELYPIMLAGAVIVSAPMIIAFFILQKYIVEGISLGGVKG